MPVVTYSLLRLALFVVCLVALVLANAVLEKFGGDSVGETKRNLDAYLAAIPDSLRTIGA